MTVEAGMAGRGRGGLSMPKLAPPSLPFCLSRPLNWPVLGPGPPSFSFSARGKGGGGPLLTIGDVREWPPPAPGVVVEFACLVSEREEGGGGGWRGHVGGIRSPPCLLWAQKK